MKKKYYIADLLKHRSIWMAAAIIFVIFFHAKTETGFPGFGLISTYGYYGVDIFFFASGVGCWFSLSKDDDPSGFFLRRIRRIVPIYLVFLVFWCAYQIITSQMPTISVLGNALSVELLRKSNRWSFNWYITGMWVSYLLAPLLFSFGKRINGWRTVLFTAFLYVLTIPFLGYVRFLIFMTRIPVFYLGLMTGKMSDKGKTISLLSIIIADVISVGGIILTGILYKTFPDHMFDLGLGWYPSIFVIPGICATLSLISRKVEDTAVYRGMVFIGKYTFELYLSHVFLFEYILIKYTIAKNYGTELLAFVISFIMAFVLRILTVFLQKGMQKLSEGH